MQHVIEIDGRRYMSSRAAAGLWELSQKYVAELCRQGRLPGAFKDTARRWVIPADSPRPLTDAELKKLLVLTLRLKNDPDHIIDYAALGVAPESLGALYRYLFELGYIKKPRAGTAPARLPYDAVLTENGLALATSGAAQAASRSLGETALDWAKVAAALLPALLKLFE